MNIIFLDVPGYEGLYCVTADGRVWSRPRTVRIGQKATKDVGGQWLRPGCGSQGYPTVTLWKDGVGRTWKVARLVALAWIPNPHALPVINHRNGDKSDSSATNLEWCTSSHNNRHAIDTGLKRRSTPGKDVAMSKLGKACSKHSTRSGSLGSRRHNRRTRSVRDSWRWSRESPDSA